MGNPSPQTLALGFVGTDAVHRDTLRALLGDLIDSHRREYRGAKIQFIIAVEPEFTETLASIADYCVTSGHKLGLLGHNDFLNHAAVADFLPEAQGNVYRINEEKSVHKGLAGALGIWDQSRLILVGDPNADDHVYASFRAALRKDITARSLIDGLDKVELEPEQEEQTDMSRRDDDFEEEEDFDDDDIEDEADDDVEDDEDDSDSVEDEEDDEADDDSEEDEDDGDEEDLDEVEDSDEDDESDADDEDESDDEEDDVEDDVEDLDDEEEESDDEESDDDEEEEDQMPAKSQSKSGGTRWTEAKLERLADNDYARFKEVVAEFKVPTGRGIRVPNMIQGILDAQDGKKPAAAKKSTAAPKKTRRTSTTSKPSTRKTSTTAKKRTARPATKAGDTKRSARTTHRASANGSTPSLAQIEKAVELAAFKGVQRAFRQAARSSS